MLKQDYLLQLIERVADVLERVARARKRNKPHEALESLHDGYESVFAIEPALLARMNAETLESMLRDPEEGGWLAHMIRYEAEIAWAREDPRGDDLGTLALELLARASRRGQLRTEFLDDIAALLESTPPERLSADALRAFTELSP